MAVFDLGSQLVAKPNSSSTPKESVYLLLSVAMVSLTISIAFVNMGAWLVLPFAGLEIAALSYAFYYVYLHSNDYESIIIEHDRIVIQKKNSHQFTKSVFQRYWTKVTVKSVDEKCFLGSKMGLFIGSHGKEVEFGGHLINDEQRIALALLIKKKLKHID